jgi:hypothetical protein
MTATVSGVRLQPIHESEMNSKTPIIGMMDGRQTRML